MSLRFKLLASALAGALILAPVQIHIQTFHDKGRSFSLSVKKAEAFAPSVPVAFTALAEAFTSALPAALASAGLGLAVVGLGVLVWKKDSIVQFLKDFSSVSSGDPATNVSYDSPTNATVSSVKRKVGGSLLGYTITGWECPDSCSKPGIMFFEVDSINVCFGTTRCRIYVSPHPIRIDGQPIRLDTIPGNLQNLPSPDEFHSDSSSVPSDVTVVEVPQADDDVPEGDVLYVSPDGISLSPPDSSSDTDARNPADTAVTDSSSADTDAQNPADTAVTDSSSADTDAQNPADTAVTDSSSADTDAQNPADTAVADSSPATTDAQNPADTAVTDSSSADTATDVQSPADSTTDTASENPVDVIVKNPADIAKAIDDVASKSVPTANSTALPDVPAFNTTLSTPEVPNVLDKFKSIASSLKLTDKVTTSFSGSCSISGSLDLWGNSVPYNIDFCPYAPYLQQAGDILVMVSGFAALLIMFGL